VFAAVNLDPISGKHGRKWAVGTIARPVILLAFLVGTAVSVGGGTLAAVRALGLWRQAKRTMGAFARELGSFEEKAARSERHLAEWERSNTELDRALERLRASRARLRVLQDAVEQAQGRIRWLRVFVP
jgi:exonuclease VII small subunit